MKNIQPFFRISLFIIPVFLLASCASTILKSYQAIELKSNKPNAQVDYHGGSYPLPAVVKIKRSDSDIAMHYQRDTVSKDIVLKSSRNYSFKPIDILSSSSKIYGYKQQQFVMNEDTLYAYPLKHRKPNYDEQKLSLTFGFPWINNFTYNTKEYGRKSNTGFMGLSSGLEYYINPKTFYSAELSVIADFSIPFPAPIDYDSGHEHLTAASFSVSRNSVVNHFNFGYGVSANFYHWNYVPELDFSPFNTDISDETYTLGGILSTYYNYNHCISIGCSYRPSFYDITNQELTYNHTFSFDFKLRLNVFKRKKTR